MLITCFLRPYSWRHTSTYNFQTTENQINSGHLHQSNTDDKLPTAQYNSRQNMRAKTVGTLRYARKKVGPTITNKLQQSYDLLQLTSSQDFQFKLSNRLKES